MIERYQTLKLHQYSWSMLQAVLVIRGNPIAATGRQRTGSDAKVRLLHQLGKQTWTPAVTLSLFLPLAPEAVMLVTSSRGTSGAICPPEFPTKKSNPTSRSSNLSRVGGRDFRRVVKAVQAEEERMLANSQTAS